MKHLQIFILSIFFTVSFSLFISALGQFVQPTAPFVTQKSY